MRSIFICCSGSSSINPKACAVIQFCHICASFNIAHEFRKPFMQTASE